MDINQETNDRKAKYIERLIIAGCPEEHIEQIDIDIWHYCRIQIWNKDDDDTMPIGFPRMIGEKWMPYLRVDAPVSDPTSPTEPLDPGAVQWMHLNR